MRVTCPHCGRRFQCSNKLLQSLSTITCQGCRQRFRPYFNQSDFDMVSFFGPRETTSQYRRRNAKNRKPRRK